MQRYKRLFFFISLTLLTAITQAQTHSLDLTDSVWNIPFNSSNKYINSPYFVPKIEIIDTVKRTVLSASGYKSFSSVRVINYPEFYGVKFYCDAWFGSIDFAKGIAFKTVEFTKKVYFISTTIKSQLYMSEVKSKFDLNFNSLKAESVYAIIINAPTANIDFSDANIDSLFELNRSTCKLLTIGSVKKEIKLSQLICDTININGKLPQRIALEKLNIKGYINLVGGSTGEALSGDENSSKTLLYLKDVDLSKIRMNYIDFQLDLYGISDSEITIMYETLLKNFKEKGQLQSYKLLDIEYRKFLDTSPYKIESHINELWWNFGYNKERIFLITLLCIILFSTISFFYIKTLQEDIYSINVITKNAKQYNIYYPKSRKIWYTVSYTVIVFLLFSISIDNLKLKPSRKHMLLTCYLLTLHAIGLLCLAYIANFVFQK